MRAAALRFIDELLEQRTGAFRSFDRNDGAHRLEPFLGLLRIWVVQRRGHGPPHSAPMANSLLVDRSNARSGAIHFYPSFVMKYDGNGPEQQQAAHNS